MKNNILITLTIILISIFAISLLSSFRVKSATLGGNSNTTYMIYISTFLDTNAREFVSPILTSISDMSPASHVVNAPKFVSGGYSNTNAYKNNKCEIGWGAVVNVQAAAVTEDYVTSGIYTEFDIVLDYDPPGTWGSGFGNTIDRKTVIRHELGHAVGLDHTSGSSNRLMFNSLSIGEVKNIGQDEINGYNCIYNNFCSGQEAGSGSLDFSTSVFHNNKKEKILQWNVETDKNSLIGFNIYRKTTKTHFISVNAEMIKYIDENENYKFSLPNNVTENENYYVEIIGENKTDNRMFKF